MNQNQREKKVSATTNHLSRTDSYELVQEQIATLQRQATALTTGARSFIEVAEELAARLTRGAISDECVAEVIAFATMRGQECAMLATNKRTAADLLSANALR